MHQLMWLGNKGKKGKNQTKNYNFGDLKYDLDHGYLKVVKFGASITCRPDIAYTVKELSRFLVAPLQKHMNAAKRCVQYLHETKDIGLISGTEG